MNKEDKMMLLMMYKALTLGIKVIIYLLGGKKSFAEEITDYQICDNVLTKKLDAWTIK